MGERGGGRKIGWGKKGMDSTASTSLIHKKGLTT